MELTPKLYHYFVRPKWFSNIFYSTLFQSYFDFEKKKVLDFGCGIGSASCLFEPKYYIGIDCDNNRIEYAKRLYPDYNFIMVKDEKLPLVENSIDYILILSVLHHISDELLFNYLENFKIVLKPNGSIIVAEPCFYKNAHLSNWFMANLDRGKYIRNEEEYLDLFKNTNYEIRFLRRCNHILFYNKVIFLASPATQNI